MVLTVFHEEDDDDNDGEDDDRYNEDEDNRGVETLSFWSEQSEMLGHKAHREAWDLL